MLSNNIHLCHRRGEAHWLTPDPAWSSYSHGIGVCIRESDLGAAPLHPFADAVAGAASRLLNRIRGDRRIAA